jgi:hypothetical protein
MGNFDTSKLEGEDVGKWKKAQRDARLNHTKLKNDANAKALKINESPKHTDVLTALEIEKSGLSENFQANYLTRMYQAGAKFGLDPYTVDLYIDGKKGNTNEPVYYQLQKLGKERAAYAEKIAKKKKEANK